MSTNQYTNLTILDCNRQHSIQVRSGNEENPALFTNELGRGIELNVGDRVSVQSIYISEIGADSDTLEFKGEDTGEKRTIYYTEEKLAYPTRIDDTYSNGSEALPLITGFQNIELEPNASLTYPVKDNETYITIQYYLNNSGDSGYLSLPRRFASTTYPTDPSDWNASNWEDPDSLDYGKPYRNIQSNQFVSTDFMYYDTSTSAVDQGFYKLRTDCSRFTLMKRDRRFPLRREVIEQNGFHVEQPLPPNMLEIHKYPYYIYKQPIKISIEKGFNSPSSVSQSITLQLKEASPPQDFLVKYQDVIRPISSFYDTNTFKPQLCATSDTFNASAYEFFDPHRSLAIEKVEGAIKYYSNFYNIYDKRPELREAGQKLNTYQSDHSLIQGIFYSERKTTPIITSFSFTEENLLHFKELFKAQKLYPELFSNDNAQRIQGAYNDTKMSVDNARYIHMNTAYTGLDYYLGGDNCFFNASDTNNRSLPLFFYFQKENEDKFTDGFNVNDLCYGFATKTVGGSGDQYITLHPELIGGINEGLFEATEGSGTFSDIDSGRKIGYDRNFNAYGTACLMGYSGRLDTDLPLANTWGLGDKNLWKVADHEGRNASELHTAGLMRYNYVGTNNPKFEYDSTNSRFYFSDLHTPELGGQEWISAGDSGSGVSPEISDNTDSGANIVYKINKRVNPYVFNPDMKPYEFEFNASYVYGSKSSSEIGRQISKPNRNIQSWSVFDSHSGIFISDFGYDEDKWDTGLWGILGFSYKQFNQTLDSSNTRNSRIVNANINNLNIPTTNSDIVSTDTRDYIVNQFGAVYFTTQLPSSSSIDHVSFLPAITQNTESIHLVAENLPRKMLRPYYCIRSDIIDAPHYVGGETSNTRLPVVAICDKQYSGGDFYFSSETDFEFTITKKKTITNITTSIHDPNQSFANVNKDCAVIYKIQSNVVNDTSVAEELLEEIKGRGKKP